MSRLRFLFFLCIAGVFAWSLGCHQCQKWHSYQYFQNCSRLPVTLHTLVKLCWSIVSAFIARWLTKTSHWTRLLRERDTVTVSVSHDRSFVWSLEEQSFPPQSRSLLCVQKKLQDATLIKRRDARNDWMIRWDQMGADYSQWFATKFREILSPAADTELKGG